MMDNDTCYICGGIATDSHEPLMGNKYRKLSIKYGLQLRLCRPCHRLLHDKPELNKKYQKEMQCKFESEHGRDEWMKVFGRSYT